MTTVLSAVPIGTAGAPNGGLYQSHATALLRPARWFADDPAAAEDAVRGRCIYRQGAACRGCQPTGGHCATR
jgi:hypothetical protein